MADTQQTVFDSLRTLLNRKGIEAEPRLESDLFDDLALDSLDVAELSAVLEDALGRDPYNEGVSPRTVAAILEWYAG